jgi:S-adenosylmethionine:tRNA ribosyltransferase-isomerase
VKTSELHYELPPERIARHPAHRRDESRLLVVDRATRSLSHDVFKRLPSLLPPGALLVLNDTRVLPARVLLRRNTGGRLEGLFLQEHRPGVWELMLTGSGRLRPGEVLSFENSPRGLKLLKRVEAGVWHAEPVPPDDTFAILEECGEPPLPPYIRKARHDFEAESDEPAPSAQTAAAKSPLPQPSETDQARYQTVYARTPGAVAAPTAGLHFTPEVLAALAAGGFSTAFVTLHVGAGTFAPIRTEELAEHDMHAEWYECPESAATAVNEARAAGRPIVAVGTTSVRVLESSADEDGRMHAGSGWTRLFIYPPYRFRAVDALLTNFHLPGSTLLAMIFAFAGKDLIREAYQEAIRGEYRFYSYGDAMLIR